MTKDTISASREQLSSREIELLQALNEIAAKTDDLSSAVDEKVKIIEQQNLEIVKLRRELEECKSENTHFREVIHTWRTRMDKVLQQLGQFNQPTPEPPGVKGPQNPNRN